MEEQPVAVAEAPPDAEQYQTADEQSILIQLAATDAIMRHQITNPNASPPTGPIVISDFTGLADSTGVNAYMSLTRWHAQGLVNALDKYPSTGQQAYRITHLGKRDVRNRGATQINALTPSTAVHAATNVLLKVTTKGFAPTSVIYFNGVAQATTQVGDSYNLQCTIATMPATAGNVPVLVQDSVTGFQSNTIMFAVT
jgi:hypothetical protein